MILRDLFKDVEAWADRVNLIQGSEPGSQFAKLMEEFGELSKNIGKSKNPIDDIGDTLVVLIVVSKQLGLDLYRIYQSDNDMQENGFKFQYLPDELDLSKLSFSKRLILWQTYCLGQLSSIISYMYLRDNLNINELPSEIQQDLISVLVGSVDTLNLIALDNKLTLTECLEYAYNEIKDRQGVMYEGTFVKSEDPMYETILATLAARRVHI